MTKTQFALTLLVAAGAALPPAVHAQQPPVVPAQQPPVHLGGPPAQIPGKYWTEESWIVQEKIDLVLWRGSVFHATIARGALTGVELRTYPISGFEHP
jgi:hypothetical protein